MYERLRLTELHEEAGWLAESLRRANLEKREMDAAKTAGKLLAYDAEIRARVAAQEIEEPHELDPVFELSYGVPDALREYRTLYERTEHALNYDQPHHWTNHARHVTPVAGCHLCRPQPTRWTPGGFVHEEHIPCE